MSNSALDDFATVLLNYPWKVTRYRFDFTVTKEIHFPEYAGSMIRGAFGRSLRKIACITHMKDCKICPLYQSCLYTRLFETPAPAEHPLQKFSNIPNPYVIEAPAWGRKVYRVGDSLSFSVVLFGTAIDQLALMIYAIKRAFSYDVGHGQAILNQVTALLPSQEKTVYSEGSPTILLHETEIQLGYQSNVACLDFETPLRLQNNGKSLSSSQITATSLLMSLIRKIGLLTEFHSIHPLDIPYQELKQATLDYAIDVQSHWQDWIRYSNRQQQKMHMGGVLGTVRLENIHPVFSLLLEVGQWTHVGKSTTFGMGKYHLILNQ